MHDADRLTPRERAFCSCFVATGSEKEAAVKAGYKNQPELQGQKLLCCERIIKEIKRLYEIRREALKESAFSGYERLAFGSISDAVRLLYVQEPSLEQLESMNLFNVSEIKRPKDGAMEIKFFDRLKALEKLEQIDKDDDKAQKDITAFYKAIEDGAKALEDYSSVSDLN